MLSLAVRSGGATNELESLLAIVTDPERTKEALQEFEKARSSAAAATKKLSEKSGVMTRREKAVAGREDAVREAEARLAGLPARENAVAARERQAADRDRELARLETKADEDRQAAEKARAEAETTKAEAERQLDKATNDRAVAAAQRERYEAVRAVLDQFDALGI